LPVLPMLKPDLTYQSGTGEGHIGWGGVLYSAYAFLLGFSTGPSLRELHHVRLREAAVAFLPWIAALVICLIPLSTSLRRARASFQDFGYLLITCVGPLAVTLLLSTWFDLNYKVSYVSWASIPLLVLLGFAVARAWGRWSTRMAAAAYACMVLVALSNRHLSDRYRTEDVRALAAYLEAHSSHETPIFVVVRYMAEPLVFYLGDQWPVKGLPTGPVALRSITELTDGRATGPTWIVYTRPFHGDPSGQIRAQLDSSSAIHLAAKFAGLDLYRYQPPEKARAHS
jgi:hypothetical protein